MRLPFRGRGIRSKLRRALGLGAVGRQEGASASREHVDVLFVNGCDASVIHPARYRVYHQVEQLELVGVSCSVVFYCDLQPQDIDSADAIVLFRCPVTEPIKETVQRAHEQGKTVFFDVDDLVVDTKYTDELPFVRNMTSEEKRIFDDGVTRTGETLALCDAAIVSTPTLQAELSKVVDRVFVNRNVASRKMVELSDDAIANRKKRRGDDVILGYFSGSLTHNEDFAMISEAVAEVLAKRPNVRLSIVGVSALPACLAPFEDRVLRNEYVDWQGLPELIATADINLAPIEDTLFNRAKSENKWVDASLVLVPTVASDVGAFHEMIDDGKTGLLCDNTTESWVNALLRLIDDEALRVRIAKNASAHCRTFCVTGKTGFPLASFVTERPCDIESILKYGYAPSHEVVASFLEEKGVAVPRLELSAEPWASLDFEERTKGMTAHRHADIKNALLVYEMSSGDTPTFRYFGYNIFTAMEASKNWNVGLVFTNELQRAEELLEDVDLVVLVRMRVRPDICSFCRTAAGKNLPVAYLIDDDVVGADKAQRVLRAMGVADDDAFAQSFWRGVTVRFEMASQLADSYIASVPRLAQLLADQYGKPSSVVHNTLSAEQIEISSRLAGQARAHKCGSHSFSVGYFSGTKSHDEDFALVEEPLCKFLQAHADARLVLGGCLNISERVFKFWLDGRVDLLPRVDYLTLQAFQASVDVVLAPVVLDEFTDCKSALKVFEAGAVETPACASPSSAAKEAIADGKSGFLCWEENEWLSALEQLYSDDVVRQGLSVQAAKRALTHYSPKSLCEEAETAFDCAIANGVQPHDPRSYDVCKGFEKQLDWNNQFEVNPLFDDAGAEVKSARH